MLGPGIGDWIAVHCCWVVDMKQWQKGAKGGGRERKYCKGWERTDCWTQLWLSELFDFIIHILNKV